jgi:hypothetical protein
MIKILIIAVSVVGAGAVGYFGEQVLRPTKAPGTAGMMAKKEPDLLFKLPLGKFTMQIKQHGQTQHLFFNIDVYVMGATAFQNINGAVGTARLRDATVTAIAEIAETDLSFATADDDEARKTTLAEQIVRKLYVSFPTIRTARVRKLYINATARE